MNSNAGLPRDYFQKAYQSSTPFWEIGRPQDDVVRLYERSGFHGRVLDVGCGTGENALFLASKGLEVVGIDAEATAIERAKAKAKERGLDVEFTVGDVLQASKPKKAFHVLLDSGLFHFLSDEQRPLYLKAISHLIRSGETYHVLCFSDQEPGEDGPRRITERELVDTFNLKGWLVEEVAEARYETTDRPEGARTGWQPSRGT